MAARQKAVATLPNLIRSLKKDRRRPGLSQPLPSLRRAFSLYDQINLIDNVPEDQLRFQRYDPNFSFLSFASIWYRCFFRVGILGILRRDSLWTERIMRGACSALGICWCLGVPRSFRRLRLRGLLCISSSLTYDTFMFFFPSGDLNVFLLAVYLSSRLCDLFQVKSRVVFDKGIELLDNVEVI